MLSFPLLAEWISLTGYSAVDMGQRHARKRESLECSLRSEQAGFQPLFLSLELRHLLYILVVLVFRLC